MFAADPHDPGRRPRLGETLLVVALALATSIGAARSAEAPRRVVSINLCTDQLALAVAGPGQVVAVSRFARDVELSEVAEEAGGLPITDGGAEEVVPLAPDLVLTGAHTSRATVSILRRLGHRVEEFAPPRSFAEIRANVLRMGDLLGRPERAAALVRAFDRRIAELHAAAAGPAGPLAVVYHVGNRAEGRGTIADEILRTAGWRNLAAELGVEETGSLPLEVVLMHRPDVVLVGSAEAGWSTPAQQSLRHPAVTAARGIETRLTVLPDRWIICGSTSVTEVVRRLVDERRRLAEMPRVVR